MGHTPTVVSLLDLDPRKFGSLEEYTVFLSRALRERGWRNVLVFSRPPNEAIRSCFDGTDAVFEVFRSGGTLQFHASLMRILLKYRGGVVHFHLFNHFGLLPILAWLARAKLVVFTEHNCRPQQISPITKWKCWLWDRIVLRVSGTRVMAVSDHVRRTLIDSYQMKAHRIQVLYNGVSLRRFAPVDRADVVRLRKELRIPPDKPVVVCAAALIPQKGVGDLLSAAKQILETEANLTLVIVGDGPLADSLQQQAHELGIQSNVRFTGLRSDVHRLMAMADIVAVPSVWQEPAGLVVIEGMATSRPVVATRVGGIPEYLEDGVTGILVEPHAPQELARALLRLLNSPAAATAMGRAGRTRVEVRFSMDRWVSDTVEVYERALRPNRKIESRTR